MNVQWKYGGPHPIKSEIFFGSITTDSPAEFIQWLRDHCPSHKIVMVYQRMDIARVYEGGYPWRLNLWISDKSDQMMFKLTWCI